MVAVIITLLSEKQFPCLDHCVSCPTAPWQISFSLCCVRTRRQKTAAL